MTTSRVIRSTRTKFFLYICGVIVVTGLITCYNYTLTQFDMLKESNEVCRQQADTLSTQLQVISDFKQRLEKSLKTEKKDYQNMKLSLEKAIEEEKIKSTKSINDVKLIQQDNNLLKIKHDNLKEQFNKDKKKFQEEINEIKSKLQEAQENLKKVEESKESLKTKFIKLEMENERILKDASEQDTNRYDNISKINHLLKQNYELTRDLEHLKEVCPRETYQQWLLSTESSKIKMSVSIKENFKNNSGKIENENQEKPVLAIPSDNLISLTKSTTKSGLKPSQGSLNGARPIIVPTLITEVFGNNFGVVPDQQYLKEDMNEVQNSANEILDTFNRNYVKESIFDNKLNIDNSGTENKKKEDIDQYDHNNVDGDVDYPDIHANHRETAERHSN